MLSEGVLFHDSGLVFFVMLAMTAFAIYAEKRWKWAATLSSVGICVFGALFLVSLKILPTDSAAYDVIFDYFVLLPIPMILVNANIKRIVRDSGRSFILMNVACAGACLGGIAVGLIFKKMHLSDRILPAMWQWRLVYVLAVWQIRRQWRRHLM